MKISEKFQDKNGFQRRKGRNVPVGPFGVRGAPLPLLRVRPVGRDRGLALHLYEPDGEERRRDGKALPLRTRSVELSDEAGHL